MSNREPAFPITEKAYAKLNISLDVMARRPDGYHDMLMLMQTISICDELTIQPERDGLVHAVTSLPYVPGDKRNLAVRAALKFLELVDDGERGMKISLRKSIPVGAGMAGGSADAAAVLRALNRAYGEPLSARELCAAGEEVGSDVAFCLLGGTALASGRGEILQPLKALPPCAFVVCKPDFSIDLDGLCRRMYNVFEDVPDRRMRTIRAAKGALLDCGALGALMTGTGSAVFGVFRDAAAAEKACETLKREYRFCRTAEAVGALL